MVTTAFILLVSLVCIAATGRALLLLRLRSYVALVGELFMPTILILVYGIGGIALLFSDEGTRWMKLGAHFSNWNVIEGFLIVLLAIIIYVASFRSQYQVRRQCAFEGAPAGTAIERSLLVVILVLLAIEILGRLLSIQAGTYFTWMALSVREQDGFTSNPIILLQKSSAPLLVAIIFWRCLKDRSNRVWLAMLAFMVVATLMEGSRAALFIVFFVVVLVLLNRHRHLPLNSLPWARSLALFIASLVVASLIVEIRYDFRYHYSRNLFANPEQLPVVFFSEMLPNALFGRPETAAVSEDRTGSGISERIQAWPTYLAVIRARFERGSTYGPTENIFKAFSLPIPSFLYPGEKPSVQAGKWAEEHLGIGLFKAQGRRFDPATTVFVDAYLYAGLIGVAVLALILGLFFGRLAAYAVMKWREFGVVIFLGMSNQLLMFGNSFGVGFVKIRDTVILVLIIAISLALSSRSTRPHARMAVVGGPPPARGRGL